MSKILVLGSVNIDTTYSVDHIVREGETISSTAVQSSPGGKGANQAAALAKAGADVYFAGKLGSDGEWILSLLRGYHADTSLSIIDNNIMTGCALIQVSRTGQNSIILNAGGNKEFELSEIGTIIDNFGHGDFIVLQNEINHIEEIIDIAYDKGLSVCLNPSPFDSTFFKMDLNKISYFFVNEIEAAELAEEESKEASDAGFRRLAEKLSSKFPHALFIMTVGKNGAYCFNSEFIAYSPIVDYPVVDTTGAGDTFCGYFLASLLRNKTIQECLDTASLASSIAVTRKGAMDAIPFASEVM